MADRNARLRDQYFPGAEELVFSNREEGFVPLPILLRKAMRDITPEEFRVYVYLCLRADKSGICYPAYDEMIHELGLTSKKNLEPKLNALVKKRFISREASAGKQYFLVHDPLVPLQEAVADNTLAPERIREVNELLADLKHESLNANTAMPRLEDAFLSGCERARTNRSRLMLKTSPKVATATWTLELGDAA